MSQKESTKVIGKYHLEPSELLSLRRQAVENGHKSLKPYVESLLRKMAKEVIFPKNINVA